MYSPISLSFSKYKFSHQFFYKRIDYSRITISDTYFTAEIRPFVGFGGRYHVLYVVERTPERILFLTAKSSEDSIDPTVHLLYPKFYFSIAHDNRKVMIFDFNMDGIILK